MFNLRRRYPQLSNISLEVKCPLIFCPSVCRGRTIMGRRYPHMLHAVALRSMEQRRRERCPMLANATLGIAMGGGVNRYRPRNCGRWLNERRSFQTGFSCSAWTRHTRDHRAESFHLPRRGRPAHHHIADRDCHRRHRPHLSRRQYTDVCGERLRLLGYHEKYDSVVK